MHFTTPVGMLRLIQILSFATCIPVLVAANTLSTNHSGHGTSKEFKDREEIRDFRVGQTGSTKYPRETLLRLFELWQKQYLAPGDKSVLQPNGTPSQATFIVFQAQNGTKTPHLVKRYSRGEPIALQLKNRISLHDGQIIEIYYYIDGTYSYTNTIGATRTVQQITEWSTAPNPHGNNLGQEDFLRIVRDQKKTLVIYDVEEAECSLCYGRGNFRGRLSKGEHPDKHYTCPQCIRGKERKPIQWQVRW